MPIPTSNYPPPTEEAFPQGGAEDRILASDFHNQFPYVCTGTFDMGGTKFRYRFDGTNLVIDFGATQNEKMQIQQRIEATRYVVLLLFFA